jgi:hypothetical protein
LIFLAPHASTSSFICDQRPRVQVGHVQLDGEEKKYPAYSLTPHLSSNYDSINAATISYCAARDPSSPGSALGRRNLYSMINSNYDGHNSSHYNLLHPHHIQ